ncbi:MAG TPA: MFS transporter [Acidimicrobiales bacterium]|nr:MFS transporter [Acidimicrobiales bacterium]
MGILRRPHASRAHRQGLALVVLATAQLMVMLDLTIVNIALPALQRALAFSSTRLAWVVDGYVLAFGGFLLLGGRAGDLLGRRRVFMAGVALFAAASLAGGLATSQAWLVAARVAQGLGAAIASPTALSLIATTFEEGPRRHRAMAVYAAMSAAGGALGLLLGGMLVDIASWRWVLFVNVPIGAAVVASTPFLFAPARGRPGRLDVRGALTGSAGVALAVFGLVRAPEAGWTDPFTLGAFVLAGALIGAFVLAESRSPAPLVPLRFVADRHRAGTYAVMLLLGGAMLSLLYFLTQYLQDVLGYSPIAAGLAYVPLPLAVGSTGALVSRKVGRHGTRPFLVAGPAFVGTGLVLLSRLGIHSGYPAVLLPLVVVGVGMGLSFVPLTLRAVSGVAHGQAGLASALLSTSQQVGGSLGLAVLVTVAATVTRDRLGAGAAAMPAHGPSTSMLLARTSGYDAALLAGAAAAALAFLVALVAVRDAPHQPLGGRQTSPERQGRSVRAHRRGTRQRLMRTSGLRSRGRARASRGRRRTDHVETPVRCP